MNWICFGVSVIASLGFVGVLLNMQLEPSREMRKFFIWAAMYAFYIYGLTLTMIKQISI